MVRPLLQEVHTSVCPACPVTPLLVCVYPLLCGLFTMLLAVLLQVGAAH